MGQDTVIQCFLFFAPPDTEAEPGHIFRAPGREKKGCAQFPDYSYSPATDNKSFVMWAHSAESTIRPAQRRLSICPLPSQTGSPHCWCLLWVLHFCRSDAIDLERGQEAVVFPVEGSNRFIISLYHSCSQRDPWENGFTKCCHLICVTFGEGASGHLHRGCLKWSLSGNWPSWSELLFEIHPFTGRHKSLEIALMSFSISSGFVFSV